MEFVIELAEKKIQIASLHSYVYDYCKEYLCDAASEEIAFRVEIIPADIDYEREKSRAEDIKEGIPVREFSDEYLETLAVYRRIAEKLLNFDTILFHGSVIAVDGKGYLFTAKSGTGKSTHTRLWREVFEERAIMVNDDKPLLKITENGVVAYGTPWNGKHHLGKNISVPLGGICILERDKDNHIQEISYREAYTMLMQQCNRPAGAVAMVKTMNLLDKLGAEVRFYRLGCNMDKEAAIVAYNGMCGGNARI